MVIHGNMMPKQKFCISWHGKIEPKLTDGTIDMNGQWYQWAGEAKKIVIKNGITEIEMKAKILYISEVVIASGK